MGYAEADEGPPGISILDRAGGFTAYPLGMRPTWTMNSEHGFRNHTTWWERKAICVAGDRPLRSVSPHWTRRHSLGLRSSAASAP
jgi:hypothetical protein